MYAMVLIDNYSRFSFVGIIHSTSGRTVIPKQDTILSIRRIPDVIKTDNGPPFQSEEFKQHALSSGFHHRKVTPLWPQSNVEAERFMATLKKGMAQNKDWRHEMRQFLLSYRAKTKLKSLSYQNSLMIPKFEVAMRLQNSK